MAKNKDWFTHMRENWWDSSKINTILKEASTYLESLDSELEEEKFEVNKGNYKTIITYKFNKKGYPVSSRHEVTLIMGEKEKRLEELRSILEQHVKDKNYLGAAKLQDQIKELETN